MDFRLTQEQRAFRQEVRQFFRRELPPGYVGPATVSDEEELKLHRRMKRRLAERGWVGLAFPPGYGGRGAGPVTQTIFLEEYAYARTVGLDRMGVKMVAPTLLAHGTQEQKRRLLPAIFQGEIEWCQGYSEPGTGSDLASLQTRAVEDGDDFVVNGTKTWTSKVHFADWVFFLARTDPDAPKHKGISFFVCPMDTPGISFNPITNMLGADHFGQLTFDNVRVPRENLVGEKNRGWYVGMTLLDFERTAVEWTAYARRMLDDMVRYCRETPRSGRPLAQDPLVRHLLANAAVEIEVGRLISYNIAWMQERGLVPNRETSLGKIYNSELLQRVAQVCMRVLGPYGQLDRGEGKAPLHGLAPRLYMGSLAATIFAGTSEIQRNIVATRGLDLPRG